LRRRVGCVRRCECRRCGGRRFAPNSAHVADGRGGCSAGRRRGGRLVVDDDCHRDRLDRGLAASAAVVVVVVVSVAAASSWLFLLLDDCFAESSAGADAWTWPGSAACPSAFGFAASGCEAGLGLAGFWALAVVLSCAEGLLLLEGGGAVVLGFAGCWLFWPCDVCAGAVLLPSVPAALDFELLFDWKLLLCCRGEPPVDIEVAGGDGFACAPVCC
jgi:hypothetical protein